MSAGKYVQPAIRPIRLGGRRVVDAGGALMHQEALDPLFVR